MKDMVMLFFLVVVSIGMFALMSSALNHSFEEESKRQDLIASFDEKTEAGYKVYLNGQEIENVDSINPSYYHIEVSDDKKEFYLATKQEQNNGSNGALMWYAITR